MYVILLAIGLSIGAIFLVVLLIGDKREAQRKVMEEQREAASQPLEGTWPPPPTPSVYASRTRLKASVSTKRSSKTTRNMVRAFSLYRNCAIGTVLSAFIIYSADPKLNFVWVLVTTAIAFVVIAVIATWLNRRNLDKDTKRSTPPD